MISRTYRFVNEDNEVRIIKGIKNAAEFLGVVASTIHTYCDSGKRKNGWLIETEKVEITDIKQVRKTIKPRKRFVDRGWRFQKFFKEGNVCCMSKTYHLGSDSIFYISKLKNLLEGGIKMMVEEDDEMERYSLVINIPDCKYYCCNKLSKTRFFYIELHTKFKTYSDFENEVSYLKNYINKIDKLMNNYEQYCRNLEEQECYTD